MVARPAEDAQPPTNYRVKRVAELHGPGRRGRVHYLCNVTSLPLGGILGTRTSNFFYCRLPFAGEGRAPCAALTSVR